MSNTEHQMAKGSLHLMIAQVIFLLSAYIIHFGLARIVTPEDYGRFGVIIAILQILQIFLMRGIPDALTKYIAEGRDSQKAGWLAFKIQIVFSFLIFILLFSFAPFIADILNDREMTFYLMVISIIIPIRAIFMLNIGHLNGLRKFTEASYLLSINFILRILFVFFLLYTGFGIFGAITGYILASFFTLIFSFFYSRSHISGKNITSKEITNFAIPMIVFSVSYLILMNADIVFIKALILNSSYAGYYTAARMLSSIIFVILFGLSFSLLPSISKTVSKNNIYQTKSYIIDSTRYLIMILFPTCVIGGIYANSFLTIFYPNDYIVASASLVILLIGTSFISLFVIFGTIISGAGKPKIPMIIGIFLVIIFLILNYVFINKFGMVGGALATVIVGSIGTSLLGGYVYKKFRVIIGYLSLIRILIATGIIGIISFFIDINGIFLIFWTLILLIIYFGILFLIKEIKKKDIHLLKEIISISIK